MSTGSRPQAGGPPSFANGALGGAAGLPFTGFKTWRKAQRARAGRLRGACARFHDPPPSPPCVQYLLFFICCFKSLGRLENLAESTETLNASSLKQTPFSLYLAQLDLFFYVMMGFLKQKVSYRKIKKKPRAV